MRTFVVLVALFVLTVTYVFWNGQSQRRVPKDSEGLKPPRGKNDAA